MSRRALLRVGGSGLFGLCLGKMFETQAAQAATSVPTRVGGAPGWGKAKSIILVFLQGGPSHLDLFDPKPDAPDKVRSSFAPMATAHG